MSRESCQTSVLPMWFQNSVTFQTTCAKVHTTHEKKERKINKNAHQMVRFDEMPHRSDSNYVSIQTVIVLKRQIICPPYTQDSGPDRVIGVGQLGYIQRPTIEIPVAFCKYARQSWIFAVAQSVTVDHEGGRWAWLNSLWTPGVVELCYWLCRVWQKLSWSLAPLPQLIPWFLNAACWHYSSISNHCPQNERQMFWSFLDLSGGWRENKWKWMDQHKTHEFLQ